MIEKSNNPSAIRSRKMIVDALLELMKKKEFSKITITDIANEAQIVRKTFYRHFYCLEDVLNEYVGWIYMEYIEELKQANIHNIIEHVQFYFYFWQKYMDFLQILLQNDLLQFILKKFDELLPDIHTYLPCTLKHETVEFEYYSSFISGAFWRILCKWIERGGIEKPEEMAKIFYRFFAEIVSSKKK